MYGSLGVFGVVENSLVGIILYVVSVIDIDVGDILFFFWISFFMFGFLFFDLEFSGKWDIGINFCIYYWIVLDVYGIFDWLV